MKKRAGFPKAALGLLGAGGILLGYFILEYVRGPVALAGCLFLFFGAAAKLMQKVLQWGKGSSEPEEMPWAERVRLGLESLKLEEPSPEGHDHIPSTELEQGEKLEQLKVLLSAGLIDREEYEEKKRKIKTDI